MKDIDEIRDFFSNDRFATENGMIIDEVDDNYAKISLKLGPRHKNAVGGVMGGVYATIADFACAVASCHGDEKYVSVSCSVSFLSPAKTDSIYAEANIVKKGKNLAFYDVIVCDENDELLCTSEFTMFQVK